MNLKMLRNLAIAAATTGLALASTTASAQIVDGGFESQGLAQAGGNFCYFGACGSGAWSGANGGGLQYEGNGAWPGAATPDGSYYGFIQNLGSLTQTFASPGAGAYTLSWLAAGRPYGCCGGNQSYTVSVNGVDIYTGSTTTGMPFTAFNSNAFSLGSGPITLTFKGNANTRDDTAFIDAVQLIPSAAVPEPATWALMLGGFGLVGAALRRREEDPAIA